MLRKFFAAIGTLALAAGLSVVATSPAFAAGSGGAPQSSSNVNTGTSNDAAANVTVSPATCRSAATLTLDTPAFAQWGPVAGSYSVVATALAGHAFADGSSSKTFTGTLDPRIAPTDPRCLSAPVCLPSSAVSYTYTPATNSGTITVTDGVNSTGLLCNPFWVTATSWKYTTINVWPQQRRDVVQKLDPITGVGSYPFVAPVSCGQGDIYASFAAQPDPPLYLDGPSNPFRETFLHGMGFSGPSPTWVQQTPGCNQVEPAPPTFTAITACGTYGSIIAADTSTVDYTITAKNGQSLIDLQGSYLVSAVAISPAVLKNYPVGGWTIDLGAYTDCPKATPGDPSWTNRTCVAGVPVGGSITVGLEPGLVYSIDGPGTAHDISPVSQKSTTGLPAGDYLVSVVAAPGYVLSGATSWPYTITIAPGLCDLPTEPLVTPTARMTGIGCASPGSYTLDANPGVLWGINGVTASAGTYRVTSTQTVVVTARPNAPAYGFDFGVASPTVWTFAFTAPDPASCGVQLGTLAFTGMGGGAGLTLAGGLLFIGIGGLFIARRQYLS